MCEGIQRLGSSPESVSEKPDRLAIAKSVGEKARTQLGKAGGCIGKTFDQTKDCRRGRNAEYRQKPRQHRRCGFVGNIPKALVIPAPITVGFAQPGAGDVGASGMSAESDEIMSVPQCEIDENDEDMIAIDCNNVPCSPERRDGHRESAQTVERRSHLARLGRSARRYSRLRTD